MELFIRFVMLFGGALFAGTILWVAIISIPRWTPSAPAAFIGDFRQVIKRVDRLQPALLVVTLVSAATYAISASGLARLFSALAAGGLLLTLILSAAVLVPLQNTIVASSPSEATLGTMRRTWSQGHAGRTVLALVVFACLVLANVA